MQLTFYGGMILGVAAGVSPGPLLTLVISQTLTYGIREGCKVAAAPLITDLPIIVLTLLVGSGLAKRPFPLGILSIIGAVYICWLAWESFNIKPTDHQAPQAPKSMIKGILTNLLNPHPYLFWMTVGTPLLLKTWRTGPWQVLLWLISFYLMLVGAKIGIALSIGYSRKFMDGQGYLWINRMLGAALLFFAYLLARDGLDLTGILPIR